MATFQGTAQVKWTAGRNAGKVLPYVFTQYNVENATEAAEFYLFMVGVGAQYSAPGLGHFTVVANPTEFTQVATPFGSNVF